MWLKVLSNYVVGSPGGKPLSSGGVQNHLFEKATFISLSSFKKLKGLWSIMPGTGTKIRYLFLVLNQNITPGRIKYSYPQVSGSQHSLCHYIIPTRWMFVEGRAPLWAVQNLLHWPRSRPWTPSIRKLDVFAPLIFVFLFVRWFYPTSW